MYIFEFTSEVVLSFAPNTLDELDLKIHLIKKWAIQQINVYLVIETTP